MTKAQILAHIQTLAESTPEVAAKIFGVLESSKLVWRDGDGLGFERGHEEFLAAVLRDGDGFEVAESTGNSVVLRQFDGGRFSARYFRVPSHGGYIREDRGNGVFEQVTSGLNCGHHTLVADSMDALVAVITKEAKAIRRDAGLLVRVVTFQSAAA